MRPDYAAALRKSLEDLSGHYGTITMVTFAAEEPSEFYVGFVGVQDCSSLAADLRTLSLVMPDGQVIEVDDILLELTHGSD